MKCRADFIQITYRFRDNKSSCLIISIKGKKKKEKGIKWEKHKCHDVDLTAGPLPWFFNLSQVRFISRLSFRGLLFFIFYSLFLAYCVLKHSNELQETLLETDFSCNANLLVLTTQ